MRTSEERFHRLTKPSSDWYWAQDASAKYTEMSGRAADREANIAARRQFLDLHYSRTGLDGSLQ